VGGFEHPHDTPPYPLMPSPTFAHSSRQLSRRQIGFFERQVDELLPVSLSETSSELDHRVGSGNLTRNDRLPEAAGALPYLAPQVEETA